MEHDTFEILEHYKDVLPFLPQVCAAGDDNRLSLGFFAASVYAEFARQSNLYVIVDHTDTTRYVGHLIFTRRASRASVVQIFTLDQYRGRGLAARLLTHLKRALTRDGYISISARVADDLVLANKFWHQQGFYVQSVRVGGKTRERTILVRSHELPSPQLFPQSGIDAANPLGLLPTVSQDVPLFLLDLNVLFDFAPRRLRRERAISIIQAERMNFCRVAVSDELRQELDRTALPGRTDPMEDFASTFPTFPLVAGPEADELIGKLAVMIFPRTAFDQLSANDISDLKHVATAIQNELAGLITNDEAILVAAASIAQQYPVQVLSPEAFTLEGREPSNLSSVESSDQSILTMTDLLPDDTHKVRQLLSYLGMSGTAIAGGWLPTRPESRVAVHRAVWHGETLLGFTAHPALSHSEGLTLRMAIDERQSRSRDAARALLTDFIETQSKAKPRIARLLLAPQQSLVRELAGSFGFRGTSDPQVLRKVFLGVILTTSNWNTGRDALKQATRITLPERIPDYTHSDQQLAILTPDGNRQFVPMHELETLLSPTLFCLPGRPAVVTPIRREFAARLLKNSRQGSLLPDDTSALFQERLYLSDPRTFKRLSRGTLILFYESLKDNGAGEISAMARVTQSYLRAAASLASTDLLQSVLTSQTLDAIGDSHMKTVTAFDNVFLLENPVSRRSLQALNCGAPNDLITTRPIDDIQLQAILNEALDHGPR